MIIYYFGSLSGGSRSTHARSTNASLNRVTHTTRMRSAVGVSGGVAGVQQRGGAKVGVWLS